MDFINDAFSGAQSAFIDIAGETVIYDDGSIQTQTKAEVNGGSETVRGGEGRGISSRRMEIYVVLSSLPSAAAAALADGKMEAVKTHVITVRSKTYTIGKTEPDAEGGALLKLKRTSP